MLRLRNLFAASVLTALCLAANARTGSGGVQFSDVAGNTTGISVTDLSDVHLFGQGTAANSQFQLSVYQLGTDPLTCPALPASLMALQTFYGNAVTRSGGFAVSSATTPGRGIPEPGSLSLLAMGMAPFLVALRRRKA